MKHHPDSVSFWRLPLSLFRQSLHDNLRYLFLLLSSLLGLSLAIAGLMVGLGEALCEKQALPYYQKHADSYLLIGNGKRDGLGLFLNRCRDQGTDFFAFSERAVNLRFDERIPLEYRAYYELTMTADSARRFGFPADLKEGLYAAPGFAERFPEVGATILPEEDVPVLRSARFLPREQTLLRICVQLDWNEDRFIVSFLPLPPLAGRSQQLRHLTDLADLCSYPIDFLTEDQYLAAALATSYAPYRTFLLFSVPLWLLQFLLFFCWQIGAQTRRTPLLAKHYLCGRSERAERTVILAEGILFSSLCFTLSSLLARSQFLLIPDTYFSVDCPPSVLAAVIGLLLCSSWIVIAARFRLARMKGVMSCLNE